MQVFSSFLEDKEREHYKALKLLILDLQVCVIAPIWYFLKF